METITSRNNPKIKYACSLKKAAREATCILAEGLRLCEDAARNGVEIDSCFLTRKMLESGKCESILAASEHTYIIDEPICDKLSDTKHPQGIFCVCKKPVTIAEPKRGAKYVYLECLRDPGNMGTIIRTAEAFGIAGIFAYGCCDVFSQKVMRASMGAIFRFPIMEISDQRAFLADAKSKGIPLYSSVIDAQAADVSTLSESSEMIVAVGNEANGLSEEWLACGAPVTIHMAGRAESLNAAQAATVMMYEMAK